MLTAALSISASFMLYDVWLWPLGWTPPWGVACVFAFCLALAGLRAALYVALWGVAGLLLAMQLPVRTDAGMAAEVEVPGVLRGTVCEVVELPRGRMRLVVEGECDLRPLPSWRVRAVVSVPASCLPPEGGEALTAGSSVAVVGVFRRARAESSDGFDEWKFCARRGCRWVARATRPVHLRHSVAPSWHEQARRSIGRAVAHHVSPGMAGVALAMLTGERHGIGAEVSEVFRRTGTAHILSISGLHVAVIAALIVAVGGVVRSLWMRSVCVVVALAASVLVAGAPESAIRAAGMLALYVVSRAAGRPFDAWNALGAMAVLSLLSDPAAWLSEGFRLSFCAVAGMLAFGSTVEKVLRSGRLGGALGGGLAVSYAATAGTALPSYLAFGSLPLGGLVVNLAVVPLSSLAVAWLVGCVLLHPLWPAAASLFGRAAEMSLAVMWWCASFGAEIIPWVFTGRGALVWSVALPLAGVLASLSATVRAAAVRLAYCTVAASLAVWVLPQEVPSDAASPTWRLRSVGSSVGCVEVHPSAMLRYPLELRHKIESRGWRSCLVRGNIPVGVSVAASVPSVRTIVVEGAMPKSGRLFRALDSAEARGVRVVFVGSQRGKESLVALWGRSHFAR